MFDSYFDIPSDIAEAYDDYREACEYYDDSEE